jgi:tRNA-binding protein
MLLKSSDTDFAQVCEYLVHGDKNKKLKKMNEESAEISWDDFIKVELRAGTILSSEEFTEAKKPAYRLTIDFGKFGIRKSSAQITKLYSAGELKGKQVIAVVNFPPKQIATMKSECLVLGVVGPEDEVTLLVPDKKVRNGLRIG